MRKPKKMKTMRKTMFIVCMLWIVGLTSCHDEDITPIDTSNGTGKQIKEVVFLEKWYFKGNSEEYTRSSAARMNFTWKNDTLIKIQKIAGIYPFSDAYGDSYTLDFEYVGDTIVCKWNGLGYVVARAVKEDGRIVSVSSVMKDYSDIETCMALGYWYNHQYHYDRNGLILSMDRDCPNCNLTTYTYTWDNGNLKNSHWEYIYEGQSIQNLYRYYTHDNMHTPWECMKDIVLMMDPILPPSKNNITGCISIHEDLGIDTVSDTNNSFYYTYQNNYAASLNNITRSPNQVLQKKWYYAYTDGTANNLPRIVNITADANRFSYVGYKAHGSGSYEYGDTVILNAYKPEFLQWSDGDTTNPRIVVAREDATYTAIYRDL